ncbi:MAG: transposase [Chloroflexales bacterium]|nr:transposase [Chloroflexales bacterium]
MTFNTRRVTFLADRGFRGREWAKLCAALRWRYMIRLANNTLITFRDGRQVPLDQLGIRPGQRRYYTNVRLTQEADWQCHLAITWTTPKPGEPAELCAIMTNWVPSAWVLKHYLRRMHIERKTYRSATDAAAAARVGSGATRGLGLLRR